MTQALTPETTMTETTRREKPVAWRVTYTEGGATVEPLYTAPKPPPEPPPDLSGTERERVIKFLEPFVQDYETVVQDGGSNVHMPILRAAAALLRDLKTRQT